MFVALTRPSLVHGASGLLNHETVASLGLRGSGGGRGESRARRAHRGSKPSAAVSEAEKPLRVFIAHGKNLGWWSR